MSRFGIVPMFHPFGRRDFFDFPTPSRLFDQEFGLGLEADDFLPSSLLLHDCYARPRRQLVRRQRSSGGCSEIRTDEKKFQVMLDVNQFAPEEIVVKTVDNCVVVRGKHEEKVDEHGYVSREFQRRYVLPDDIDPAAVISSLSHDGVLTVEAPRAIEEAPKPERVIPIQRKDAPAVTQETNAEQ